MKKLSINSTNPKSVQLLDIAPSSVLFEDGMSSFVIGSKKFIGCCVNCEEKYCMEYSKEEILPDEFRSFPHNTSQRVCPTEAIEIDPKTNKPTITSDCICCGLCVYRCPFAAIQLSIIKGRCTINHDSSALVEGDILQQQIQARRFRALNKNIAFRKIPRSFADTYSSLLRKKANSYVDLSEIVVRNSLINMGFKCGLNAHGNNHIRIEFYATNNSDYIIGESEITDTDTLSVSRRLLDDLAVLISRYNISKRQIIPLGVINGLPNKRTDFYEVLEDVKKVTDVQINILTYHILFVLNLFNTKLTSNDISRFIIGRNQNSLLSEVLRLIPNIVSVDDSITSTNYYAPNK